MAQPVKRTAQLPKSRIKMAQPAKRKAQLPKRGIKFCFSTAIVVVVVIGIHSYAINQTSSIIPPPAANYSEGSKKAKNGKTLSAAGVGAACPQEGSFTPPSNQIIIDYEKIRSIDQTALKQIKDFTVPNYVQYLLANAGKEHYPFLHYMSTTYGDCRHFTDIGTRYVASSLAVASNWKSPVWTFDIPTSNERSAAFQGKTEEEWQRQVQDVGVVNIKFHNLDLLKVPDEELKTYLGTWFTMLDTFHKPYSVPFEREFFQRILDIEYKGILGLDDIHLNDEMKKWWKEVQDGEEEGSYKTYDITKIGHYSGTGLVDFSGKVTIKE